jgi:hypothetical protein
VRPTPDAPFSVQAALREIEIRLASLESVDMAKVRQLLQNKIDTLERDLRVRIGISARLNPNDVFRGGAAHNLGYVPDPGAAPPSAVLRADGAWHTPLVEEVPHGKAGTSLAQRVVNVHGSLAVQSALAACSVRTRTLDVFGLVTMGGDLIFKSPGKGLLYGCASGAEINWSQASMTKDQWYAVSDANIDDGPLNSVTHDGSGKLTVTEPGVYMASYAITAEMSGANNHAKTGFLVNGSLVLFGEQHMHFPTASAEQQGAVTTLLTLADNAYVEVGVMNPDTGTPTITVDHFDLTLVQIAG